MHQFKFEKQYIEEVYESKSTGLQSYNPDNNKGDKLSRKGIEALEYEIQQRSKPMTSGEVANKVLEYCSKFPTNRIFEKHFVQRHLTIPKTLIEQTLVAMEKADYARLYDNGFIIKSKGYLTWNDISASSKEVEKLKKKNEDLDIELKQAQLELTQLQIKEAKNKKKIAVIAALLGALLTNITDHVSDILKFFQQHSQK